MYSKIKKIFKTRTLIDSSISLIGNGVGAVISLLVLAILTRSLTTSEFGVFTSVRNLYILIGGLVNFGFSHWLLANYNSKKFNSPSTVYSRALSLILITSTLFIVAGLGLFSQREKFIGTSSVTIFFLTLFGSIGNAIYTLNLTTLQAQLKFLKKSYVDIGWNAFRLIPIIILAYYSNLNDTLAVISSFSGFFFGLALSFKFISQKININIPTFKQVKSVFRFSFWLGLNQITITLYGRLNVLLLTLYYSAELVALYGAADQLTNFFPIIISSVSSVVSARFATFNEDRTAKSYYKRALLLSIGLASSFLLINQIAEPIISLVLSEKYLRSIPVFKALVIANIPLTLSIAPVSRIIYFHKKSKIIFFTTLIQLLTLIVLNLIWLPKNFIMAPANSLFIANSLGLLIYTYYLWIK